MAWRGMEIFCGKGRARHGKVGFGVAVPGEARLGKAWTYSVVRVRLGVAGHGVARRGEAGWGKVW